MQSLHLKALSALIALSRASLVVAQGGNSSSGGQHGGGKDGGGNSAHGGGGGKGVDDNSLEVTNIEFSKYLFLIMGGIGSLILLCQVAFIARAAIRRIVSVSASNQNYWAMPDSASMLFYKRDLLYAPLGRTRHNREFRISTATSIGTLPSRLQTLILLAIVGSNAALAFVSIDWSNWTQNKTFVLSQLRNRAGVLATINMAPLFLLAGRNNPLIPLLGISFDSMNAVHRWLGRIVVVEALLHTAFYMASKVIKAGFSGLQKSLFHSEFIFYGFLATIGFTAILLLSPGPIRHAFYETFLGIHIILALFASVTLYQHLAVSDLRYWLFYLKAALFIWGLERIARLCRVVYRNVGLFTTVSSRAVVSAAADASVIEITMPRPWKFMPGQHVYLTIPSVGWCFWQSHPFSVSWSENKGSLGLNEKPHGNVYASKDKQTIELIAKARTGFTRQLFEKASSSPSKSISIRCFVEGPYGGMQMDSYGSYLFVAGGIGITHPLPYLRQLLDDYAQGVSPVKRITLVWVLASPLHLSWVKQHMGKVLAMEGRREVLKVLLFVTQPNHSREIVSPSSSVKLHPGKPNFEEILKTVIKDQVGTLCVNVCGPGSMGDDVRSAVRSSMHLSSIEYHEESFTW